MESKAKDGRLRAWARGLRRDIAALRLAGRDPRVPLSAKLVAAAVAAYALSPIDLIPDFVPLLGYLDDLLIVPLGIWLAIRMIPPELMSELRERALDQPESTSLAGLAMVLAIWLAAAAICAWLYF